MTKTAGNNNQDEHEVHDHQGGDDHDDDDEEKSPNVANKETEDDDTDTNVLDDCGPAIASPPLIAKDEMQTMFFRLMFSQIMMEMLVEDQGIDSLGH